ncbi:MAG: tripartite tricarboxylate transporter TctB family protein [Deltaproteobacteria bacterium]|nr:tripartite tricarboxylate transporter TctB family protein [Deltaproteobacteria bacterium]
MSEKRLITLISAAVFLGLAFFILYQTMTTFVLDDASTGGPFADSAFYPRIVAGVIVVLSVFLILSTLVKKDDKVSDVKVENQADQTPRVGGKNELMPGVSFVFAFMLISYTLLVDVLGYVLVTPFFMGTFFWLLKVRKPFTILLLSLISTFGIYFFFQELLDVVLPPGRHFVLWP